MNNEYLERAKEVEPDGKTLILLASRRARQLAYGARPMVRCKDDNFIDIALLEIAEGKLRASFDSKNDFFREIAEAKDAARRENATQDKFRKPFRDVTE